MSVDQKNPTVVRIPSVLAAFLVRTCAILNNPLDPMYKAVSNFLLAKPLLSIFSVPEFLRLFHSKEPLQHDVEREWIVTVLRDGLRDDLSYSLMQQNFVFKMVQSFHDSSLAQVVRYFFIYIIEVIFLYFLTFEMFLLVLPHINFLVLCF